LEGLRLLALGHRDKLNACGQSVRPASALRLPVGDGGRCWLKQESPCCLRGECQNIDYEEWPQPQEGLGCFHAQWRRQNPCDGISDVDLASHTFLHAGTSTAYWYQSEPHQPFGILPVEQRLPRTDFPAERDDLHAEML